MLSVDTAVMMFRGACYPELPDGRACSLGEARRLLRPGVFARYNFEGAVNEMTRRADGRFWIRCWCIGREAQWGNWGLCRCVPGGRFEPDPDHLRCVVYTR